MATEIIDAVIRGIYGHGFSKVCGGLKCVRGVKIFMAVPVFGCGSMVFMRTALCGRVSP